MADPGTSGSPPTMPVTIHNCFWEDIPREEALARLERRSLDAETRRRIEDNVPELTRHYLTFEGRAFREYVEPNDRPAELLLFLPLVLRGEVREVIVPIYESEKYPDGRIKHISGIDVHRYELREGRLIENGVSRDTFRYSQEPVQLNLNLSMLGTDPERRLARSAGWCCDACEWVHSTLDIHCADWLCCIGTCRRPLDRLAL
jgi:hypothetical protein